MVVQSLGQLEKNVSASFGYVKKDLLMLNDAISDINDKIQHLSLNHAALLEKLQRMGEKKEAKKETKTTPKKSKTEKKELEFYDLKNKRKFKTTKYAFRIKSGRRFAVATSPSGVASWRVLGNVAKSKSKENKAPKRIVKETIEY
jgi:chromatin remodeling complex protein RSC6